MLDSNAARIDSIRTAAGVQSDVFNNFYTPLLIRFAEWVQRVPLQRSAFHSADGALHFGLESALIALRAASQVVFFPKARSEDKRVLEPQCRFLAFAAALASAIVLQAQHTRLFNATGEYHPLISPVSLFEWLGQSVEPKLEWRTDGVILTAAPAAAIAARFIPNGLLDRFDLDVVLMFYGAIAPQPAANGIESALAKTVRMACAAVLNESATNDKRVYRPSDAPAPASPAAPASYPTAHAAENPAAPQQPINNGPKPHIALLNAAHPVIREWFASLEKHEKGTALKASVKLTGEGVVLPIVMLGHFGVSASTIRGHMQSSGLIRGVADGGKSVLLDACLAELFGIHHGGS